MQLKLFNRWGTEGIKVVDPGLKDYISLEPVIIPRSSGRYAGQRFYKSKIPIIERLMNKLMIPGHKGKDHFKTSYHITGKIHTAYDIIEKALRIVEQKTKHNPIAVFVKAVENSAPREEIITIEYGGARYPKAVESSPQRRIDVALRYMVQGAYQRSFNSKTPIEETLAEEIIAAYNLDSKSQAITKKFEVERQADASR